MKILIFHKCAVVVTLSMLWCIINSHITIIKYLAITNISKMVQVSNCGILTVSHT